MQSQQGRGEAGDGGQEAGRRGGGSGMPARTERGALSRSDPLADDDMFSATPFTFLRRFAEDIDSLFEEFRFPTGRGARAGEWNPVVELETRENEVVVRAELPGVKRQDIQVDLQDDVLCISGERRQQTEGREGGQWRSERRYGRFCRRLPMPAGVDTEHCRATFEDGVLEVTIPIETQGRGRRIEIGGREAGSASSAAQRREAPQPGTSQQHG